MANQTEFKAGVLVIVCGGPWIGDSGQVILVMRCFLCIMLDRMITMLVRKTNNVALDVDGASGTDNDYPPEWFSNDKRDLGG
jgi:hypothetical protein